MGIVSSVSVIYYFLNNGNAFQSMLDAESDSDEIDISEDITTTLSGAHYIPEDRRIVD